jgi:hypothetical protein
MHFIVKSFFSDYQHMTQAFLNLNKQVDELHGIGKSKHPNLYQQKVANILSHENRQLLRCSLPGGLNEINRC